jgi:hypothetical protein
VTINLPPGTYLLTIPIGASDNQSDGDLNLYGHVRIVGAGFDLSIIDANHLDRAFHLGSSAVVTLSDLRVQGGRPPADFNRDGGADGGGILNDGGDLTLLRCLVRANQLTTSRSGGGIYSNLGSLTLIESVVRINGALDVYAGGGIYSYGTATSISRSTVNGNSAYVGAGIFQSAGSLKIVNSTVSQNAAAYGGGIYLEAVTGAALNNVTVATNTASGAYLAGAQVYFSSGSALLSNSIFYHQVAELLFCNGGASVTSNGYNMMSDSGNCSINGSFIHTNFSIELAPIAFNGGLTVTHAPYPGSFAINAGDPSGCLDPLGAPLTTDQRGVKRPIGARCDLGALEVEPIGDANGDSVVDVSDVFYLVNFLFAGGPVPRGRANVNGDSAIDVNDVFYLINFLFAGGKPPG